MMKIVNAEHGSEEVIDIINIIIQIANIKSNFFRNIFNRSFIEESCDKMKEITGHDDQLNNDPIFSIIRQMSGTDLSSMLIHFI
jgi:hypothetical protein